MTERIDKIAELVQELEALDCEVNVTAPKVIKSIDETKGRVGNVGEKADETDDSNSDFILELADKGKGFALYKDFSKGSIKTSEGKKLLRLSRE